MFKFLDDESNVNSKVIEKIIELEEKYNIRFPDLLKNLYLYCEDKSVNLCVFKIDGCGFEVASITSIIGERDNFEKIADSDKADGFLPETFYPLASDRGGNNYYWDSETKKIYLSLADDIENPVLISNNPEEFISLLNASVR